MPRPDARARARSAPTASPADLVTAVARARSFAAKLRQLQAGKRVVFPDVEAAAQGFVAALCARHRPQARVWMVVPDLRTQENLYSDLATWLGPQGRERLCFFPQMEVPAFEEVLPDPELVSERLEILHRLLPQAATAEEGAPIVVLVAASLDEDVPRPDALASQVVRLCRGGRLRLEDLVAQLEAAEYERVPVVAERGQFAVRGGLVDVFSWQAAAPVRIEFFDEEIDSLRTFDVNQQTSVSRHEEIELLLSRGDEAAAFSKLRELIGPDDLVCAVELPDMPEALVSVRHDAEAEEVAEAEDVLASTACQGQPLGPFTAGDFVLQEARRESFRRQVLDWQQEGWRVVMFFHTEGEIERFRELMPEVAPTLECLLGELNHGFTVPAARLAVLADAEVFGRYQHARARRLFAREQREYGRRRVFDVRELEEGDLVVHQNYGIAKYRGLLRPDGAEGDEVLALEFADKAMLYLNLNQAHLVSRYVGTGKTTPPLSKLGDEKWSKTRKQAEKSIFEYAAKLLAVQAERQSGHRPSHAPDNKWQWEFENSFIYKETPDQLRAIQAVKADMEGPRPMDRLICGDVGFGKTEVAIRALFKCVMSGRQAVVLAPTTVLAEQHWRNLRERMSDYPIRVDLLCRWRTRAEQNDTLKGLREGAVDIVVGTHRLLSKDVVYKNLGLVVVDEEQRFGVAHKEKFKELFRLVDVLTLSATPIPRTLYMALMGARDMSTMETPPPNRVPVQTHICPYDERIIRDAINRELARGGQVYFLHNRVHDIGLVASRLRALCPGAKIDVGHGQMEEEQLEEAMKRFVEGRTDVFVCTTIIESGIDIPNANTIIIDRADRFGLADLYQLRGRVGRAGHQAYAYLLLPRDLLTTGDARKRVQAIRQYSQLGAGLKIAMRDLEIRGAGNLLGTQQSGHIFNIGFELYCQLLQQAVARLKNGRVSQQAPVAFRADFLVTSPAEWKPELTLAGKAPCYIPESWLEDAKLRIASYKEVAEVTTPEALEKLRATWTDRFGAPPSPAENLLRVAEVRLAAAARGIEGVEIKQGKLMLTRRGEYILIGNKFPRLTHPDGGERLREAASLIRKL